VEEATPKATAKKKRAAPAAKLPAKKKAVKGGGRNGGNGDGEKKAKAPGGFAVTPYLLAPCLQKITGEAQLPRPQVVKKIWEYIRAKGLQNPANKSEIHCDVALQEVMGGNKTVTMFSMNKFIGAHLAKL